MLLTIDKISKSYSAFPRPPVKVLHDVSLTLDHSEALGLVGESGSGKSTIAKCLMALTRPEQGSIVYDGIEVTRARATTCAGSAARCRWCSRIPMAASTRA